MAIRLGAHLGNDGFDDIHRAKKVLFKLISHQRQGSSAGCKLLDRAYHCFTGTAEQNVDLTKGVHGLCNGSLTLPDNSVSQSMTTLYGSSFNGNQI